MARPYQVLLDRSYAVCSGYRVQRTKQEEKTEQPITKEEPGKRSMAPPGSPPLYSLRNSLLRCYPEGAIAILLPEGE